MKIFMESPKWLQVVIVVMIIAILALSFTSCKKVEVKEEGRMIKLTDGLGAEVAIECIHPGGFEYILKGC